MSPCPGCYHGGTCGCDEDDLEAQRADARDGYDPAEPWMDRD